MGVSLIRFSYMTKYVYIARINTVFPADIVEICKEVCKDLLAAQEEGRNIISSFEDGLPVRKSRTIDDDGRAE
ncbi:hypothetical protein A13U_01351 [Escherichia coli KTE192]|nr:hypothetical protein A13U_01351 [Escherichia coli KTE192]